MITEVKILFTIVGLSLLTTILLKVTNVEKWWIALIICIIFSLWLVVIAMYNDLAFTYTDYIGNNMRDIYGRQ